MPPTLDLRLLGRPTLVLDGRELEPPQPKVLALLCYLAAVARPCPRDELTELLWGAGRGRNLRMALYKARALPHADAWLRADDRVELLADSDAARLERAASDPSLEALHDLLGPEETVPFEGLDGVAPAFDAWLEGERARLERLARQALRGAAERAARHGELDAALEASRRLARGDPLDEAAVRLVMRLEHERGRDEAALWHFERFRELLEGELGVAPDPATLQLVREVERGLGAAAERAALLRAPAEVAARPAALLAREELLGRADDALARHGNALLVGLGGIGKTAVAAELAARRLQAGRGPVLWATAAGDDAEVVFDAVARALDGAGPARAVARATDKAATLRGLLADAAVALVVLDDARNAAVLARARAAVPEGAALLVTSRRRHAGFERIQVERLPTEAGRELLELHAGGPLGAAGAELSERLAGHPFALRVAGLRVAREGLGADELLRQVREGPLALRLPQDLSEEGRDSVSALLESSAQQLSDAGFEAMMALGALFVPSVTPELLARMLRREPDACEEALFELQTWGLAERQVDAGSDVVRYRTHDLVYEFAGHNGNLRSRTTVRACLDYARRFAQEPAALDAELPNLLAAAAEAGRAHDDDALVEIVAALAVDGAYFASHGHSPRSLALLGLAAEAAERLERVERAHYLHTRLGNAERELLGDGERALASYVRAQELARRAGDPDREAVLTALVGATLELLGRPGADEQLRRAHDLARAQGAPTTLLHVLQNLGFVAGRRGDFERARRLSEEAVAAARRLPADDPGVTEKLVYALLNLGQARRDLGRPEAAVAPLEEALALAEGAGAGLLEGFALQALGETHHDLGQREAAASRFRAAARRYRELRAHGELAKLGVAAGAQGYELEPHDAPSAPPAATG